MSKVQSVAVLCVGPRDNLPSTVANGPTVIVAPSGRETLGRLLAQRDLLVSVGHVKSADDVEIVVVPAGRQPFAENGEWLSDDLPSLQSYLKHVLAAVKVKSVAFGEGAVASAAAAAISAEHGVSAVRPLDTV